MSSVQTLRSCFQITESLTRRRTLWLDETLILREFKCQMFQCWCQNTNKSPDRFVYNSFKAKSVEGWDPLQREEAVYNRFYVPPMVKEPKLETGLTSFGTTWLGLSPIELSPQAICSKPSCSRSGNWSASRTISAVSRRPYPITKAEAGKKLLLASTAVPNQSTEGSQT
jgi:hypothetical protein